MRMISELSLLTTVSSLLSQRRGTVKLQMKWISLYYKPALVSAGTHRPSYSGLALK